MLLSWQGSGGGGGRGVVACHGATLFDVAERISHDLCQLVAHDIMAREWWWWC